MDQVDIAMRDTVTDLVDQAKERVNTSTDMDQAMEIAMVATVMNQVGIAMTDTVMDLVDQVKERVNTSTDMDIAMVATVMNQVGIAMVEMGTIMRMTMDMMMDIRMYPVDQVKGKKVIVIEQAQEVP